MQPSLRRSAEYFFLEKVKASLDTDSDKVWIILYLAGSGLSKKDKAESVTCNKFIRLSRALEVALTVPCRSLWRIAGEPERGV